MALLLLSLLVWLAIFFLKNENNITAKLKKEAPKKIKNLFKIPIIFTVIVKKLECYFL